MFFASISEIFIQNMQQYKQHQKDPLFLHSNKNSQYEFTSYTTNRILNYTTGTMPLGAKYYDYSVASQKTKTTYI